MRNLTTLTLSLCAAAMLSACGGGGEQAPGNQAASAGNAKAHALAATQAAVDLAQGKAAAASTNMQPAALAFDNNGGTRWESTHGIDPAWLSVDLGASAALSSVVIDWEAANAAVYQIQGSNDNVNWTTLASKSDGVFGNRTDSLTVSGSYRYVRMYGTKRSDGNAWGYSIFSMRVYGVAEDDNNPPNFGPNVTIFDPSMPAADIQAKLNAAYSKQETNQFGPERYAFAFKPGAYAVDANLGFYEHVLGLGLSPDDVKIAGNVHIEADWLGGGNATQNFWRSAENMAVTPPGGTIRWSAAQAVPFRRMHVIGNMWTGSAGSTGWASGGYIADTKVDNVYSGSQQQWFYRNTDLTSAPESVWNMVFVGVPNAPATSFPNPPITKVAQTPVVREKPFLFIDGNGKYNVLVPPLKYNAQGTNWSNDVANGTTLPISQFYIVRSDNATADNINAALARGKNLLFTPGVYHLSDTLRITRANTVVLGLGMATLIPDNGVTAMSVADVDGVKIAGLLFDAGTVSSPALLEVGPSGASADHSANPVSLTDIFMRVGGTGSLGRAAVGMKINSNNVIGDHFWIWRADHGDYVGWTSNTSDNGLIVNGANVTLYGMFVEHFQKYQLLWNGNGGKLFFFQNEIPYDVPNQAAWMDGGKNGFAAYKVADSVTSHEAWGLGSYSYFNVGPDINLSHSFEVPNNANVKFHSLTTIFLNGYGSISNVINNVGGAVSKQNMKQTVVSYP